MIGVFSDTRGDLEAFDRAYEVLKEMGARRFFFLGGRYEDLDAWVTRRNEAARGGRAYSDTDFLADVTLWLSAQPAVERPPAFGEAAEALEEESNFNAVKDRFLRVPERECLQYRAPAIAKKALDMLGDTLCCIVHDKNDLDRDDLLNASVFLHGRGAEPKVVQIGPRFFLTPGQLTGAAEQTFGLLELKDKVLQFSAFTLDGRVVIESQQLALDKKSKLSVK